MTDQPSNGLDPETKPIFSIGHSSQPIEAFLRLLAMHGVEVVADVRSQPYSKYAPQFNVKDLRAAIERAGMRYLYLGKELGGRPVEEEYYDSDGRVLYSRVAKSPQFLHGLSRLEKGAQTYRIGVTCSEEDPTVCHRYLLIGRVLLERRVVLRHIRSDGRVETQRDLDAQSRASKDDLQLSFLPEAEADQWKSIRSVLRREPRAISSER